MSFIGNGVGRQIIMPGQIAPAAVGYTQLDSTITAALGGRNRIINGACNIAQRAAVAVTGGGFYGGPDRYQGSMSATNGQFTQSQGSITFGGIVKNAVVQTVNTVPTSIASGNYWWGIKQLIEQCNSSDLLGAPVTVSFIFNTNVTGLYACSIQDTNGTNSCVQTFSATANVPQKVAITFPTLPTTLNMPFGNGIGIYLGIGGINTGTYQVSTLNSWQTGSFFAASGATNWAATIGNFISATEIQLEAGSVATAFERRSYEIEYLLCQRYYQLITCTARAYLINGTFLSVAANWIPMRATPTQTLIVGPSTAGIVSYTLTVFSAWGGRFEISGNASGDAYALQATYALSSEL